MKEFSCVVTGCDARVEAETEDGIMQQVAQHAKEVHGMDEVPPELAEQVRAGIVDRPAA